MNGNTSKTHCKHGHPFDAENTYYRPGGGRACRICLRERSRRYEAAHVRIRIRKEVAA